ncbi:hypothetical protein PENTCL1PPCAC_5727, partial [Pristionchus entomophagus]
LILPLLFMATAQCTLMDERKELKSSYKKLKGLRSKQLVGLLVDDFIERFPALSTSSETELATFKEELRDFMTENDWKGMASKLNETLSGSQSK